jgi:uncharacterized coiled-coil protein SlyX
MATKVDSAAELKRRIADLETKRKQQRAVITENVQQLVESVKPTNLIRAGLQSISETPVLRQNLINAVVSLSTGWLARKLAVPKSDTIVRRTVGAAVQYGVSHLLATRGDELGGILSNVTRNFQRKKKLPKFKVKVKPPR